MAVGSRSPPDETTRLAKTNDPTRLAMSARAAVRIVWTPSAGDRHPGGVGRPRMVVTGERGRCCFDRRGHLRHRHGDVAASFRPATTPQARAVADARSQFAVSESTATSSRGESRSPGRHVAAPRVDERAERGDAQCRRPGGGIGQGRGMVQRAGLRVALGGLSHRLPLRPAEEGSGGLSLPAVVRRGRHSPGRLAAPGAARFPAGVRRLLCHSGQHRRVDVGSRPGPTADLPGILRAPFGPGMADMVRPADPVPPSIRPAATNATAPTICSTPSKSSRDSSTDASAAVTRSRAAGRRKPPISDPP